MTDRQHLLLDQLQRALHALEEAVSEEPGPKRFLIDATIQRFEFTFELYWKTAKRFLEAEGFAPGTPRETLIEAYGQGWIEDEGLWLSMMQDRNLSSHAYNELLADEIYERVKAYAPVLRTAVNGLALRGLP